jgi:hypothetical protein
LHERFEPGEDAALAMGLAGLLCAAELDERLSAGFFHGEAIADARVSVQSDVAFEFSVELAFDARAMKESAETKDEGSEFGHVRGPA